MVGMGRGDRMLSAAGGSWLAPLMEAARTRERTGTSSKRRDTCTRLHAVRLARSGAAGPTVATEIAESFGARA